MNLKPKHEIKLSTTVSTNSTNDFISGEQNQKINSIGCEEVKTIENKIIETLENNELESKEPKMKVEFDTKSAIAMRKEKQRLGKYNLKLKHKIVFNFLLTF